VWCKRKYSVFLNVGYYNSKSSWELFVNKSTIATILGTAALGLIKSNAGSKGAELKSYKPRTYDGFLKKCKSKTQAAKVQKLELTTDVTFVWRHPLTNKQERLMEIPSEIENMVNLEEIIIDSSGLPIFPESIGSLKKLRSITLKDTIHYSVDIEDILLGKDWIKYKHPKYTSDAIEKAFKGKPVVWGGLTKIENLEELRIIGRYTSIPKDIGNLSKLRTIYIEKTFIDHIPESFCNLKNLSTALINYNPFLTNLPNCFGDLTNLKHLKLNWNNIETLPESIGNLKNLEYLYLYRNNLTQLPDSIGDLQSLKILDISLNKIKEFPRSLFNLGFTYSSSFKWDEKEKTRQDPIPDMGRWENYSNYYARRDRTRKSNEMYKEKARRLNEGRNIWSQRPSDDFIYNAVLRNGFNHHIAATIMRHIPLKSSELRKF